MNFLFRFSRSIESFTDRFGRYISWLTTLLVVLICYDVAARYIFKFSSVAVQELEWHIFAALFLLGGSYTLKTDRHVRVDLIYSRLSPKNQALVDLAGTLLLLIPFCVMVVISSKDFVINSFVIGESSPDPGGLPARYLIKSVLPLSFILLLLQGLALFIKSLQVFLTSDQETEN